MASRKFLKQFKLSVIDTISKHKEKRFKSMNHKAVTSLIKNAKSIVHEKDSDRRIDAELAFYESDFERMDLTSQEKLNLLENAKLRMQMNYSVVYGSKIMSFIGTKIQSVLDWIKSKRSKKSKKSKIDWGYRIGASMIVLFFAAVIALLLNMAMIFDGGPYNHIEDTVDSVYSWDEGDLAEFKRAYFLYSWMLSEDEKIYLTTKNKSQLRKFVLSEISELEDESAVDHIPLVLKLVTKNKDTFSDWEELVELCDYIVASQFNAYVSSPDLVFDNTDVTEFIAVLGKHYDFVSHATLQSRTENDA